MAENKKSIFTKKEVWISLLIGIIIGIILLYLLELIPAIGNKLTSGELIVTSKTGKITERTLFKQMKKNYPISYLLELVDKPILEKKYPLTDEQEEEIVNQAESILKQYENYGYTEQQFCEENGFENKEDFIDYMKLDYRRNLYCTDYFKTLIAKEDIEKYYNENEIFGKINTKHVLVQITDEVTDAKALALAKEIISKLDSGTSFEDIEKEYEGQVIAENISFDGFETSAYESSFVDASKSLEAGAYTKEPVKTSYGYHVIYCISKEDKPSLEQAENSIVEILAQDLEEQDQYIRYKALIKLREENNVQFKDEKYAEQYKEYCDQVNKNNSEN